MKTPAWMERLSDAKRELLASRDVVLLRDEKGQRITLATAKAGERRSFQMLAYTGATVERWYGPMTIDLQGIEADQTFAILFEHMDTRPVGVCTKRSVGEGGLVLEGHMLSNPQAQELAANADEGLPYKCSVGIHVLRREEVAEGATAQVNGRTVKGPHTIARAARLFECSFITCDPADPQTAAVVMHREEAAMADLKDAPNATEQFRAEATKAAREELRKRAEELRKAFPDRLAFADACALEGLDVTGAKAKLADELQVELKKEREAKANDAKVIEDLRAKAKVPAIGFDGAARESLAAEPVENLSAEERAKREWHSQPVIRLAFPDVRSSALVCKGVEAYAAWLRLEERLKAPAVGGFGGLEKSDEVLKLVAKTLKGAGGATVERLASWAKSGPDYADMTVKGYLGMLYRPLEDSLGGSWAQRAGVLVPSTQETETYRFFGQVPQFREWVGNRQRKALAKYAFNVSNKTYEITLQVAIPDFTFEKSGQLQIRFGETGRRAGQHWEKLISSLITTNGLAYDGIAFFSANHTLGGDSGTMKNTLVAADVPALNVAQPNAPTVEECANALTAVTAKFYGFLDDKGEPINGDAKKFLVMVPTNLWANMLAATRLNRLNSGSENVVKAQDVVWEVVPNPRLDSNSDKKFYVFREDSMFKPFVLQEATGVEVEFQGPGSAIAFDEDAYALGLKTRRAASYGEWAHAMEATFS